ncbi:hypothetical protein GCM10025868_22960 [Angustibacter aerolatus]|uniref:Uncharacterized protein n=1 Tax=Angustibacter aerolatus TaxID=1162965 RepID=A0ABQ6JHN1_9ACTN|nr:hypothetical protein GCM10025868_22960 [Angustibacter aerolatus]
MPRCLLASVVIALGGALVWYLAPSPRTRTVAVPPAGATPEQVVLAYLDALDAHDCDTVRRLTVPEERSWTRRWCRDVASARHPRVLGTSFEGTRVGVGVSFDLTWRRLHDDGSMAPGDTSWGYTLQPVGPDGAWQVVDQGMG